MQEEVRDKQLGVDGGPHIITDLSALQQESCRMAAQCRQRLLIYSQRLAASVYEQACFLDAVKALAIRHGRTHIRILLADIGPIRLKGHRLLNLGWRLTSSVEFRLRHEELAGDMRSYLLADNYGYIKRPVWHNLHDTKLDYRDPFEVRRLEEEFSLAWDRGTTDPDLRQLSI